MSRRVLALVLIGILFAGIGVYVGVKKYTPAPVTGAESATFFASTFPDARGAPVPMNQYQGKPVLINFWATWCPPCVDEMPELDELQKEFGNARVQIIGIGIDSAANIAEFSQKHNIDYPLVVAGAGGTELSRQFGNKAGGLPFTILLDGKGRVNKQYLGRIKLNELRSDLQAL